MTENGAFVFPPPPRPSLPVRGTGKLFPVHRIYCVGRNYAEHAIEMGHDPDREPPFFFQKNPDNLVTDGGFPYPDKTADVPVPDFRGLTPEQVRAQLAAHGIALQVSGSGRAVAQDPGPGTIVRGGSVRVRFGLGGSGR